jgi:hypothetical protein
LTRSSGARGRRGVFRQAEGVPRGDGGPERLQEVAVVEQARLVGVIGEDAEQAVRLQLHRLGRCGPDAEQGLDVVAPLVGEHRDRGVVAELGLLVDQELGHEVDGLVGRAVEGVRDRLDRAAGGLERPIDDDQPGEA